MSQPKQLEMKDECWSQFSDRDRSGRKVVVVVREAGVEYELLGVLEGLQRVLVFPLVVVEPAEQTGVQPGLEPPAHQRQEGENDDPQHHQRHGEVEPVLLLLLPPALLTPGQVGPGETEAGRAVAGEVQPRPVEGEEAAVAVPGVPAHLQEAPGVDRGQTETGQPAVSHVQLSEGGQSCEEAGGGGRRGGGSGTGPV